MTRHTRTFNSKVDPPTNQYRKDTGNLLTCKTSCAETVRPFFVSFPFVFSGIDLKLDFFFSPLALQTGCICSMIFSDCRINHDPFAASFAIPPFQSLSACACGFSLSTCLHASLRDVHVCQRDTQRVKEANREEKGSDVFFFLCSLLLLFLLSLYSSDLVHLVRRLEERFLRTVGSKVCEPGLARICLDPIRHPCSSSSSWGCGTKEEVHRAVRICLETLRSTRDVRLPCLIFDHHTRGDFINRHGPKIDGRHVRLQVQCVAELSHEGVSLCIVVCS
mmetsp:Transcript_30366/g.59679  ORF Transcript_30366/g.59679 Transcript_30366/m.59679 type:complete len:277 (-) Transcript_30366:1242-2072(-)